MKKGAKHGKTKRHGLSKHTLYRKWQDMKKRCYNPNVDRYVNYGALGIEVCDEWRDDFPAFYHWSILSGWVEGLTIERIDISLNYTPDNCEYIPYSEQCYNKSTTLFVEWEGEKLSLSKLCNRYGLNNNEYKCVWRRYRQKGEEIKDIITKYKC